MWKNGKIIKDTSKVDDQQSQSGMVQHQSGAIDSKKISPREFRGSVSQFSQVSNKQMRIKKELKVLRDQSTTDCIIRFLKRDDFSRNYLNLESSKPLQ